MAATRSFDAVGPELRFVSRWLGIVGFLCLTASPATAQTTAPDRATVDPGQAPAVSLAAPAAAGPEVGAAPATPAQEPGRTGNAAGRFLRDVGSDYRNYLRWETAEWLAVGGVAALAIHGADDAIREELGEEQEVVPFALEGGAEYGNLSGQVPFAIAWWAVGHWKHNARATAAGRDMLRAQISALSWTYVFKFAADRTRPNGDPRSFPSGHASAAFATASVLQQHYGWKLGVPMYAASVYTAVSRITVNKHWASDVTFGAIIGITAGRTVTLRLRNTRLAMVPQRVPGGGAILFTSAR